jgi:peptide/nickel transport system substrate-binding protein
MAVPRYITVPVHLAVLSAALLVLRGAVTPSGPPAVLAGARPIRTEPLNFSFQYTGPAPRTFHEAPMLADMVARGELPPVARRLPDEPLVIPPVERIGDYGGTWRRAFVGPFDGQNVERLLHDSLLYYDMDGVTLMPHIVKSWEASDDGRVFTLHLRRGMRWSDGEPFTADDLVFGYEDLILNEELSPVVTEFLRMGRELGRMEKIDDATVRFIYPRANRFFLEQIGSTTAGGQSTKSSNCIYAPRHYLKQFHPRYANPADLDRLVKEAKQKNWVELMRKKASLHQNPDLPVVGPWKPVTKITDPSVYILERNPYYWAVDPAGNQLPYIDRIELWYAADMEVLNLRAIAGEIDMQHRHIQLSKLPVLRANEEKGGYRVFFWPGLGGSEAALFVNQTWDAPAKDAPPDIEVQRRLRSREFRIALSLAIDREEINELTFLGTGSPRAFITMPDMLFYPGREYEMKYAVRDLAEANRLLDEIGLTARDSEGFRLRSDGDGRLVVTLSVASGQFIDYAAIGELLVKHWAQAGLKVHLNVEDRSLWVQRREANEHQLSLWDTGGSENPWIYTGFTIPNSKQVAFAPKVGEWCQSGGKLGAAPADPALERLLEIYEEGRAVSYRDRAPLGRELWRIHADNLFVIGTVGRSPAVNGVVVVKNNFRNVPEVAPNSAAVQNPGIARTEQFFFEDPTPEQRRTTRRGE